MVFWYFFNYLSSVRTRDEEEAQLTVAIKNDKNRENSQQEEKDRNY